MARAVCGRGALQLGFVFLQNGCWEKCGSVTMSVCLCAVSLQVTKLHFAQSINPETCVQSSL